MLKEMLNDRARQEVKRKKKLSLLRIKTAIGFVVGMAVLIFALLMHKEIMAGISNLLGH